tara:strand:+ start:651 stop:881 length:231 start_codon:yes stop_codon:yes gene_type:complete
MKHVLSWSLACLTLGLLPYSEPHIFGKIKWIFGGAEGMQLLDWFDFVLHGFPWFGLLIVILITLNRKPINIGNQST